MPDLEKIKTGMPTKMRETLARLLPAVKAGDKEAINELVTEYQPRIDLIVRRALAKRREARTLLITPGESTILQITLLEIARDIGAFKGDTVEELMAWVLQVAKNNILDAMCPRPAKGVKWIKSLERELNGEELELALLYEHDPSEDLARKEQLEELREVVLSLPSPHHQFISLRFSYELSYAEIGAVFEITANAARKACQRALHKLRQKLDAANRPLPRKPR